MEAEGGDFQDWELLHHNPDPASSTLIAYAAESKECFDFVVDDDSDGMIQTNYFSLDSQKKRMSPDVSEVCSENSDNPSWIDPALETRYPRKHSTEFWSDSSSNLSDGKKEVGFLQTDQFGKKQEGLDGAEHIMAENEMKSEKFWSDSGGIGSGEMIVEHIDGSDKFGARANEASGEENHENKAFEGGDKSEVDVRKVEDMRKKSVVWWKLPMDFLRYCVFKGPVWTFSVAAAVMGFVILGRRLYKMKKKSRTLDLKVTVDDKKISQFMSRAARLNEAFSVVKRVPVIRPSLPAVGVTPWPVVSLR